MLRRGFRAELRWFLVFLGTCVLLGLQSGFLLWSLVIALSVYVLWMHVHLYRLEEWIHQARRQAVPEKELHGVWADISDDVRLMHNRHEKEKLRLQAVVFRVQEMTTALTDGVILIDRQGNIEWWNKSAALLFNFQDVDLGHKLTNLIRHPKFVRYFDQHRYEEPLELSSLRQKDQHLQFQVHPFGQGERLVVVRDITRVYKLEQMRRDFVANVSHELRTPLTVIRGYLETMEDSVTLPAAWSKAIGQMQQQSQRMTVLIDDLLVLTKLETDERELQQQTVAVAPLVATIVDGARALSGERQHIISAEGEAELALYGSERELHSALSNLVTNAVNYSPAGSRIQITYGRNTGGAFITVTDKGIGIDPKHIPRLTERFYRVDGGRSVVSGGTGLGLAIVKHVLLRHDAQLKIESQPGRGSSFACLFPSQRIAS